MRNITLKQLVMIGLFIALSITIGEIIVSMPGFSAGAWMLKLAPAALFIFLLFLFQIEVSPIGRTDWVSIFQLPDKRDLNIKLVLILISLAFIPVITLSHYGAGLTITLSFLLASLGIFGTCAFMAIGKKAWGLSLLIVTFPIVHFLEYEFRVIHWANQGLFFITPTILILWLVGFVSLITQIRTHQPFEHTPFIKVWLFFVICLLLSATFSANPQLSFRTVIYSISISIPFFVAMKSIKTTEDVKMCCAALGIAGTIRVLTMLYFELVKISAGFHYGLEYYEGHPVIGSLIWGASLGFFFFLGFAFSDRKKMRKVFFIAIALTLLIFTIPKLPRSAIIGIVLGIMCLLLLFRQRRVLLFLGLIIAIIATIVLWPILAEKTGLGRFEQLSSVEYFRSDQRMRLDAYQASLSMARDHPLVGIGPGMWPEYYPIYAKDVFIYVVNKIKVRHYVEGAHNIYLQYLATTGILGLLSITALSLIMFQHALGLFRELRRSQNQGLAVVFVSLTVFYWTMSALGGNEFEPSQGPDLQYGFWLFLGLMVAWRNINMEDKQVMGITEKTDMASLWKR